MATSHINKAVQQLRQTMLHQDGAGLSDGRLLDHFIEHRDEAAFAALVRRHGSLVWGVCWRILGHLQDAEDSFQATFLVLARKAASVCPREMLANWLYGVARRTALKTQATAGRRRTRERQVMTMPEPESIQSDSSQDLELLIDQELACLPDKYRVAIVMHDLECMTGKEVARQLKIPEGTLSSRLRTARGMLAKRLARHGLLLPSGAIAAVLSQHAASASVPTVVMSSTIKAAPLFAACQAKASSFVSAKVAALTEGVLKAMFLTKLKVVSVVLLALVIVGVGTGSYTLVLAGNEQRETTEQERNPAVKATDKPKVGDVQKPLDPKLLAKFAAQLRSKNHEERSAALASLAKLLAAKRDGETDFGPIIEPLFDLAGWGGKARDNARMAENLIVRIGKQATPLLRQRLKSPEGHDRRVAAELLVRIGPPDVSLVALLRPLLTDPDDYVRKAAIDGLGILGSPAKEAVDDLERVATNDPILPRRVAARIALIRVAGASEKRVRALADFLNLQHKEPMNDDAKGDQKPNHYEAAVYAASAIGELGPKAKAAAPQLVAALKHPKLRFTAANTLGQIGVNSPEAITVLIDLLKNDPTREGRRSAAGALGAFGPAAKAAIPALGAALKGDVGGGWWVAADALGKIGGAEVVPILMEAVVNPDPDIRLTSMRRLGKLGVLARPALKALEKARQEDPRGSNRAAAAEAVRKIKQASTPVNDIPHSANP